jgi:hypothetical protein
MYCLSDTRCPIGDDVTDGGEVDVDCGRDDVGDVNIFEVTEDAEAVTVAESLVIGNCVGVTMTTLAKEI